MDKRLLFSHSLSHWHRFFLFQRSGTVGCSIVVVYAKRKYAEYGPHFESFDSSRRIFVVIFPSLIFLYPSMVDKSAVLSAIALDNRTHVSSMFALAAAERRKAIQMYRTIYLACVQYTSAIHCYGSNDKN